MGSRCFRLCGQCNEPAPKSNEIQATGIPTGDLPIFRHMDARRQNLVFGEVASLYHRLRPRYPEALVSQIVDHVGLGPGGDVLEVGAGTGLATIPFAALGLNITAIEPDKAMADVLANQLQQVALVRSTFEAYEPTGNFHFVYAAQSWHWLESRSALEKSRGLLRPGGSLGLMWNLEDPNQPDRPSALDGVYDEFSDDVAGRARPARLRDPAVLSADLRASELFGEVHTFTHPWSHVYETNDFVDLQLTHSPNRLMKPDRLAAFLEKIGEAVEGNGGSIAVQYTTYGFVAGRV